MVQWQICCFGAECQARFSSRVQKLMRLHQCWMVIADVKLPYMRYRVLRAIVLDNDLACFQVLAPEDDVGHGPRYLPCFDVLLSNLRMYPEALFQGLSLLSESLLANDVAQWAQRGSAQDIDDKQVPDIGKDVDSARPTSSQPFRCFSTGCRASAGYSSSSRHVNSRINEDGHAPFRSSYLLNISQRITPSSDWKCLQSANRAEFRNRRGQRGHSWAAKLPTRARLSVL